MDPTIGAYIGIRASADAQQQVAAASAMSAKQKARKGPKFVKEVREQPCDRVLRRP